MELWEPETDEEKYFALQRYRVNHLKARKQMRCKVEDLSPPEEIQERRDVAQIPVGGSTGHL